MDCVRFSLSVFLSMLLVFLPIISFGQQVLSLGSVATARDVGGVTTHYQYSGLNHQGSGQLWQVQQSNGGGSAKSIYVPITLPGIQMACRRGELCAHLLGNGDLTLYQYRYNIQMNPYQSLSQKATYRPNSAMPSGYQMMSQTRYDYNTEGQLVATVSQYRQQGAWKTIQTQNQHDALGRLVQANKDGQIHQSSRYRYDGNGNILSRSGSHALIENYNGLDQAVSINNQLVSYDADGNQRADSQGDIYQFNARNELISYEQGLSQVNHYQYTYYADGYRADKQFNGQKLAFYYEGDQLLNTVSVQQKQMSHYLLADSRVYRGISVFGLQAKMDQGYYELLGHQGNVNGALSATGQLVSTQQYGAYGVPLNTLNLTVIAGSGATRQSNSINTAVIARNDVTRQSKHRERLPRLRLAMTKNGASAMTTGTTIQPDPFGYDGAYQDAESGLVYLHARYYNPKILHFVSQDSYLLMNRYAFANGDPVDRADPSGHFSVRSLALSFGGLTLMSGLLFATLTASIPAWGLSAWAQGWMLRLFFTAGDLAPSAMSVGFDLHDRDTTAALADGLIGLSALVGIPSAQPSIFLPIAQTANDLKADIKALKLIEETGPISDPQKILLGAKQMEFLKAKRILDNLVLASGTASSVLISASVGVRKGQMGWNLFAGMSAGLFYSAGAAFLGDGEFIKWNGMVGMLRTGVSGNIAAIPSIIASHNIKDVTFWASRFGPLLMGAYSSILRQSCEGYLNPGAFSESPWRGFGAGFGRYGYLFVKPPFMGAFTGHTLKAFFSSNY